MTNVALTAECSDRRESRAPSLPSDCPISAIPRLFDAERQIEHQSEESEIDPLKECTEGQRVSRNRELLLQLEDGLPLVSAPHLGPLVRPSDKEEPFQRWFRYREGFTVELCRQFIRPTDRLVLDPFCGFGSTLLAASGMGIRSVGMDVSPLAAFVSRVKSHSYSRADRRAIQSAVSRLRHLTGKSIAAPAPVIRILPKLFHPSILRALLVFRAAIDSIRSAAAREFLLLAWLAILEGVSNVFREGNGVKYRNRIRRGNVYSVLPYEQWESARFPRNKFGYVRSQLLAQAEKMFGDIEAQGPISAEPVVLNDDVRNVGQYVQSASVDLALFSPPYCNCFNYIKAYKLELWMAGFIREYPDIRKLTSRGIRSRVESLLDPVTESYPPEVESLAELMSTGRLWSQQLPDVVRGYFADLQAALTKLAPLLKSGGRCVIVAGNSAYAGTLIPTDLLIARIGARLGLEVQEIAVARHLTTSSQQRRGLAPIKDYMRESAIILRKP